MIFDTETPCQHLWAGVPCSRTAGAKALRQDGALGVTGITKTSVVEEDLGFTLSKMWTSICIGWPRTGTASQLPKWSLKLILTSFFDALLCVSLLSPEQTATAWTRSGNGACPMSLEN